MSEQLKTNIQVFQVSDSKQLDIIDKRWRNIDKSEEIIPYAQSTSYVDIAENIIKDSDGHWKNPVLLFITQHKAITGARTLGMKANAYFNEDVNNKKMDILSISAEMSGSRLQLKTLLRVYDNFQPDIAGFFEFVGDEMVEKEIIDTSMHGNLIIPDEIKNHSYTENEIEEHRVEYDKQMKEYEEATNELPFLNRISKYVPREMWSPEDSIDLIYDLKTKDMTMETLTSYDDFQAVFRDVMTYVSGTEYYHYCKSIAGDERDAQDFLDYLEIYIKSQFIDHNKFCKEDLPKMREKLYRSLYQLYIVQDLIDDPDVTDVKITAPDSIRARVKGKAYISNISFIDEHDYLRFVNGIAIRNGISQNVPSQTFTDTHDDNYILRMSLTSEYVNSVNWPYLHIRKVSRKKMMADDLIAAGMFDEKIRDYLLDCGKHSSGVVFAGPPGSGKTVCLNWFLEDAYEQSAEILVIQENDELFAYRKGVMFEHVVNYAGDKKEPVSLERLGQLALVAGANVFVIGETKGAEICSAITLSNSGCRTAITIHSPSATETIDKMADLAMRGYAQNYTEALRMLKSFQTIVYLENFSVKEISEIVGYDENTHQMKYKCIYRKM